jgi:hypothetical protein
MNLGTYCAVLHEAASQISASAAHKSALRLAFESQDFMGQAETVTTALIDACKALGLPRGSLAAVQAAGETFGNDPQGIAAIEALHATCQRCAT